MFDLIIADHWFEPREEMIDFGTISVAGIADLWTI
jgi:hypothetical protein